MSNRVNSSLGVLFLLCLAINAPVTGAQHNCMFPSGEGVPNTLHVLDIQAMMPFQSIEECNPLFKEFSRAIERHLPRSQVYLNTSSLCSMHGNPNFSLRISAEPWDWRYLDTFERGIERLAETSVRGIKLNFRPAIKLLTVESLVLSKMNANNGGTEVDRFLFKEGKYDSFVSLCHFRNEEHRTLQSHDPRAAISYLERLVGRQKINTVKYKIQNGDANHVEISRYFDFEMPGGELLPVYSGIISWRDCRWQSCSWH